MSDEVDSSVRDECKNQIQLLSRTSVVGGRDYVYFCKLERITGVFRLFLSVSPSREGRCYSLRYTYVNNEIEEDIANVIPRIEAFD